MMFFVAYYLLVFHTSTYPSFVHHLPSRISTYTSPRMLPTCLYAHLSVSLEIYFCSCVSRVPMPVEFKNDHKILNPPVISQGTRIVIHSVHYDYILHRSNGGKKKSSDVDQP